MIKKYNCLPLSIKASIWFLLCSIFSKGISFITLPIFTRILSTEEYGMFSLYLSWKSIVTIFASLNLSYQIFNNGMVKYKDDKDGYTSSMIGLTLVCCLLCFILFLLLYRIWFKISGLNIYFLVFMFLNIIFESVYSLWIVRTRYDFKYKAIVIFSLISTILNPILGVILVKNMSNKVFARIFSILIISIVFGIISLILMLRKNSKLKNTTYWKFALKLDLPLIPHYLSTVVLDSSDRLMIGSIVDKTSVAIYSISYQVSMLMNIVLSSINNTYAPWIYRKLERKDYASIKNKTNYLIILVAILSIFPMLFAPEVINILGGENYVDGASIIPISSISIFMIYLYSLFSFVELYFEKSIYIMIGSLLSAVINVVLNLIFINCFGYKAAAYTTFISYLCLSVFHFFGMRKVCKENRIPYNLFDLKCIFYLTFSLFIISILVHNIFEYVILRLLVFIIVMNVLGFYIVFNKKQLLGLKDKN